MICLLFGKTKLICHVCTVYLYCIYLKIMLITYINLSDLRPIIQSAILLICKSRTEVSYGIGTNCQLPCLQNLITLFNLVLIENFLKVFPDW